MLYNDLYEDVSLCLVPRCTPSTKVVFFVFSYSEEYGTYLVWDVTGKPIRRTPAVLPNNTISRCTERHSRRIHAARIPCVAHGQTDEHGGSNMCIEEVPTYWKVQAVPFCHMTTSGSEVSHWPQNHTEQYSGVLEYSARLDYSFTVWSVPLNREGKPEDHGIVEGIAWDGTNSHRTATE